MQLSEKIRVVYTQIFLSSAFHPKAMDLFTTLLAGLLAFRVFNPFPTYRYEPA
jgi:hypothetical protein